MPMIIDTAIGGDPDDAIALAIAARHVPQLALVVTSGEQDGYHAGLARHLLDLLDRRDVPVVTGGHHVPPRSHALGAVVSRVLDGTGGSVCWLGLGPMTHLAHVLRTHPQLARRLRLTQAGGTLTGNDPDRNLCRDPAAARAVLVAAARTWLVTSEVATGLEITTGSQVYHQLAAPSAPTWARLLAAGIDRWIATRRRGTIQHGPLTLSAALGLGAVQFDSGCVEFEPHGRLQLGQDGPELFYSIAADHPAAWRWLTQALDPTIRW
jgi:inosine-uridine nucleoside N-ribohydrolase